MKRFITFLREYILSEDEKPNNYHVYKAILKQHGWQQEPSKYPEYNKEMGTFGSSWNHPKHPNHGVYINHNPATGNYIDHRRFNRNPPRHSGDTTIHYIGGDHDDSSSPEKFRQHLFDFHSTKKKKK